MKIKRILAVILSAVILLGCVPMVASAEESDIANQNMMLSSDDITLSGTNSVGNMLAAELEEAKEQTENSGNVIFSVEIEENSAVAELSTAVSATLFVGIYSEDGMAMLSSGYTEVVPEDEFAVVELEGEIPEYFYVKAYLVDTEDYSPLSAVYNNAMYTQEMQEFLSKTTDDFAEDRVINLDGDKTTNFAVLADDVVSLDETAETNKVTFADTASQLYIIENIDSAVSELTVGDTFSGVYNGEILIVKIGEIAIDGTTATILGDDAELEEVFDYVRIEGETGIAEDSVDDSACGEGITFEGLEQPATYGLRSSAEGSRGATAKFKINFETFGNDNANVTLDGSFNLSFVFSPKFYISTKYKYIELKLDYNLSGAISVTGKLEYEQPLAFLTFGIPCVRAEVVPKFVVSVGGSVGATGTLLKGTIGYGWYSDVGGVNLTSTPKMEVEANIEVTVFIGLRIEPAVKIMEGVLAETSIVANVGAELEAELTDSTSDPYNTSEKHDCKICVDGEIYGKFDLSVKGKLLKNDKWALSLELVEIKIKITDFYWSMTHGEFGFTTCPHISYKLEVVASDSDGKAIEGATVMLNGKTYTTDKNGTVAEFLPNGEYKASAEKGDLSAEEKTVYIKDDAKTLKVELKKSSATPTVQAQKLSLGGFQSAFIDKNGDLYMWGDNEFGQLGDGTTENSLVPKKIMSNVSSVSLGGACNAAITENGDLYMWGSNSGGSFGDGTTIDSYIPKKIMGNVASVSLGGSHSGAITENGDLYMWGENWVGQLGDGTTNDSFIPKKVMSNIASVSLGAYHSGALTENGDLYMWGDNYFGELGDGTTIDSLVPKKIMSNVSSVSLGHYHSAVITENGDLYMWGYNGFGQLGNGTTNYSLVPIKITIPSAASQSVMVFSMGRSVSTLVQSSFENLAPNTIYNFYIMKDKAAENALSGENLLYVNQATTDSEGTVTFEYLNTGADFDTAEKFVVKYKNPLPDNTVSGVAITASADKVFLNVGGNTLLENGYENIRAEVTLNGKTTEIAEYTSGLGGLQFNCDISDGAAYNSVISVKLLADFDGKTYECRETHRTLFEAQCDTNADGAVNALDLTTLKKVLIGASSGDNTAFDPNADGEINILDLVRLNKTLAA